MLHFKITVSGLYKKKKKRIKKITVSGPKCVALGQVKLLNRFYIGTEPEYPIRDDGYPPCKYI